MRWLNKYPITVDEIVGCLQEIYDQIYAEELIGDMRPLLLKEAMKRIKATTGMRTDDCGIVDGIVFNENITKSSD